MILKEISNLINVDVKVLLGQHKITIIGTEFISVQNYLKLLQYSKEKVVLRVKNNELNIEGVNLNILELGNKELAIAGAVNKIYLAKEIKNAENKL